MKFAILALAIRRTLPERTLLCWFDWFNQGEHILYILVFLNCQAFGDKRDGSVSACSRNTFEVARPLPLLSSWLQCPVWLSLPALSLHHLTESPQSEAPGPSEANIETGWSNCTTWQNVYLLCMRENATRYDQQDSLFDYGKLNTYRHMWMQWTHFNWIYTILVGLLGLEDWYVHRINFWQWRFSAAWCWHWLRCLCRRTTPVLVRKALRLSWWRERHLRKLVLESVHDLIQLKLRVEFCSTIPFK